MEFHRSTSASRQSRLSSHLNATDVSRGAITSDGRLLTRTGLYRAATAAPSPSLAHPLRLPRYLGEPCERARERERERWKRREGTKTSEREGGWSRGGTNPHGGWFSSPCRRPTVSVCVCFAAGGGGGEPPRHIVNCPMVTVRHGGGRGCTPAGLRIRTIELPFPSSPSLPPPPLPLRCRLARSRAISRDLR